MNKIRKRLTYANVMSTIAVFLVLGGATAFAASKIGANQLKANSVLTGKIKKEAITTSKLKNSAVVGSKVKDGSLTGSDINLSTLGTVPSATNAVNAGNANTVGGRTVTKIFAKVAKGATQTIATFGVYKIVVACSASGDPEITLSTSATDTDFGAMGNGTDNGAVERPFYEREQDGGSLSLSDLNVRGTTTFSAAQSGGAVTTGTITYDDTNTFNNEPTCAIFGQVIS